MMSELVEVTGHEHRASGWGWCTLLNTKTLY